MILALAWPRAATVQRCCVHKLRNLERKPRKHALPEIHDDFHRIVYAAMSTRPELPTRLSSARGQGPSGVVAGPREGGDELLTFFRFPRVQSKALRTTNTDEQ